MQLSNEKKQKLLKLYPQLSPFFQQQNINETLDKSIKSIPYQKGDKGDIGERGEKGERGDKGDKGDTGERGERGEKGDRGLRGYTGEDGKDGVNGKDIVSHETAIEVAQKLNTLKEVVDVSVIKGAVSKKDLNDGMVKVDGRIKLIDQRWHGGGLSKVSHDSTLTGDGTGSNPLSVVGGGGSTISPITIYGTIDDSNVNFTANSEPTLLNINGSFYEQTGGAITWTYSSGNITLSVPVGSGGSIYGVGVSATIAVTGTIDDSNVTFSSSTQPTFLVINGGTYLQFGGSITWSYVSGTITLSVPVGTGGSIYGF